MHDETSGLDLAHFNAFPSKASGSLGASQPAVGTVQMALKREGGVRCASVPDELSMQSAVAFASMSVLFLSLKRLEALVHRRSQDPSGIGVFNYSFSSIQASTIEHTYSTPFGRAKKKRSFHRLWRVQN
jgi:hypothetical protein